MSNPRWIIVNGVWEQADSRTLQAESRAVWYGDGCFETLRSYAGRFLRFGDHMDRLRGALNYLQIDPPIDFAEGNVKSMVRQLLVRNKFQDEDTVIRFQIWREGNRGFKTSSAKPGYALTALPLPVIPESVKLATVPVRRIPSEAVNPCFKLSNSINYIQAANEAAKNGADDGLMLSIDEYISETTIANIFWFREGTVYTPSKKCDILPGITREILIRIIEEQLDATIEIGEFQLGDILDADAVWICNSIRELVPVKSIDGEVYPVSGAFIRRLRSLFESFRNRSLL